MAAQKLLAEGGFSFVYCASDLEPRGGCAGLGWAWQGRARAGPGPGPGQGRAGLGWARAGQRSATLGWAGLGQCSAWQGGRLSSTRSKEWVTSSHFIFPWFGIREQREGERRGGDAEGSWLEGWGGKWKNKGETGRSPAPSMR